jgi:hypothetical protein
MLPSKRPAEYPVGAFWLLRVCGQGGRTANIPLFSEQGQTTNQPSNSTGKNTPARIWRN